MDWADLPYRSQFSGKFTQNLKPRFVEWFVVWLWHTILVPCKRTLDKWAYKPTSSQILVTSESTERCWWLPKVLQPVNRKCNSSRYKGTLCRWKRYMYPGETQYYFKVMECAVLHNFHCCAVVVLQQNAPTCYTDNKWVLVSFMQCWLQWEHECCVHVCWFPLSPLAGGAGGALAGAAGAGGGAWAGAGVWLVLDARRTSMRQVGQVCCLWNQERRQLRGQKEGRTTLFQ